MCIRDSNYIGVELNLTKGQTVDFEGFSYLDYMLQPEYFTNENGQYKFNAPDSKYKISYNKNRELIYVEKTTGAEFPETVWITGATFGHPRISGLLADDIGNWGWENPKDFICCVKTCLLYTSWMRTMLVSILITFGIPRQTRTDASRVSQSVNQWLYPKIWALIIQEKMPLIYV